MWVVITAPPPAHAQQPPAGGERVYRVYCAACHGARGEGGRGADLTARRLSRGADDAVLAGIILAGIPGTEMPGTRLQEGEVGELVAYIRALRQTPPAPATGDPVRGRELYRKANCASCHAIGGEGGLLLDLTEIGARRGPSHLRTALVDPEAYVPDGFAQYRWVIFLPDNFLQVRVVTRDGRAVTGARLNEDAFSIQIRDYSGDVHSFWKSELEALYKDWGKSPMPSYKDTLKPEEIDDLVAYLASLKGRP
jgi:putative heme-binding domain-containing protein